MNHPPVCILNSLPKSGTHLLKKLIGFFPGMYPVDFHLGPRQFGRGPHSGTHFPDEVPSPTQIPVGVGRPRLVLRSTVQEALRSLGPGAFATAHAPHSAALEELLSELGIKMVVIVRDPRDVVVSHAHYIHDLPADNALFGTPLHRYYQTLTPEERIMVSMTGVRREPEGPVLLSIRDRLASVLAWPQSSVCLRTRFEWLVGERGGGTRDAQLREIQRISRHLGFTFPAEGLARMAEELFGNTATFRKGQIGGWREQFSADHQRVCRELLGPLLAELGYQADGTR